MFTEHTEYDYASIKSRYFQYIGALKRHKPLLKNTPYANRFTSKYCLQYKNAVTQDMGYECFCFGPFYTYKDKTE